MFKRLWKVGLLAILAGALGIYVTHTGTKSYQILSAKGPIAKGEPLSEELFEVIELPVQEGWMVKPGTSFEGVVAARNIGGKEYLSTYALAKEDVITFAPEEREFTVHTDLARSVAGDLEKGDLADVLFVDKGTLKSQPLFTVVVLAVENRSGQSIHESNHEIRDTIPATVKIKVTTEQAAELLAFEQRGLIAFAKIPDEALKQVVVK